MVSGLILETTFLVDLERELLRGDPGCAQRFLEANSTASLSITFTIAGELATGMRPSARSKWEDFLGPFEVLPFNDDVCWEYGQAYRYLKTNGLLVGTNDLWIGAAALAFGKPLVTRNVRDFSRIPGLTLLDYIV